MSDIRQPRRGVESSNKVRSGSTAMARLIGVLVFIAFASMAEARVHSIAPTQYLSPPGAYSFEDYPALAVAIHGDSLIIIADQPTYRGAFLYRRRAADGRWSFNKTLALTDVPVAQRRAGLAMKNNLAVIDITGQSIIWERVSTGWVPAHTASPILLPGGYAISVDRVLIGGDGCSTDGFIYQKTSGGLWDVTGRLPSAGGCVAGERDVELNYDYALVNSPAGNIRAYRRNGTAIEWASAGSFQLQGQSVGRSGPMALQKAIGAAPGSTIYRRSGTTWTLDQTLMPADYGTGTGDAQAVLYRDNVLITIEGATEQGWHATPHLYVPDAAGKFQNVGILDTNANTTDIDISGNTVVAASEGPPNIPRLAVFELPTPVVPPNAIVNDFNNRDASGFQTTPAGAYSIVGSGSQWFYRQPSMAPHTEAVVSGSDWSYYQSIDVQVHPGLLTYPGTWVGAALRYIDADNYYFASIHHNHIAINRRLNGVNTELAGVALGGTNDNRFHDLHFHIRKNAGGLGGRDSLVATFDSQFLTYTTDTSPLTHGSAALLTNLTRADFDNLQVSPSSRYGLLSVNFLDNPDRPLETSGGTWAIQDAQSPYGIYQTNTNVLATAVGGAPIDDQRVRTYARLESFGAANPVPWLGVIARYQDPSNYYFLSVRGSGTLQIRKIVNGVTTVLAARDFAVNAGEFHHYELHVVGDQLHASVDGVVLATAHDSDLPVGRHGIATYHAAAFFNSLSVDQP